ncbi:Pr6Pr family membrane protein [Sporosarcina highlanderae]|uniref:Pr6Pr family membrane protein n=1 Tax=Sporosarcina highlanderae TaxID=3035916 RepID=A0ABT8JSM4_9BACL|nr:Pr6Pr family membrane protein [Sporosarcina highlanderae]MDN4608169.1 Pr6Pr family membrane protein [Sporosarcina highlanderae]
MIISFIGFLSVILHIFYSPAPWISITKFTIQSNLLVSVTFLLSVFAMRSRKHHTPLLDFLKNCSVIYMFIVITTYHFLLVSGGEYVGTRIITNFTLHYLLPLFVFTNWIAFEVKKKYSYTHIFYWMLFPLLYCVVSLLRGLVDGFYPYFFLNPTGVIPVGVGSYANVGLFIIAYLCVYIILGFFLILLNRIFLHFKIINTATSSS